MENIIVVSKNDYDIKTVCASVFESYSDLPCPCCLKPISSMGDTDNTSWCDSICTECNLIFEIKTIHLNCKNKLSPNLKLKGGNYKNFVHIEKSSCYEKPILIVISYKIEYLSENISCVKLNEVRYFPSYKYKVYRDYNSSSSNITCIIDENNENSTLLNIYNKDSILFKIENNHTDLMEIDYDKSPSKPVVHTISNRITNIGFFSYSKLFNQNEYYANGNNIWMDIC